MSYKSSGKKLATNDTFVFQREMELRKEGVFTAHWSPENGIKTRKRLEKQFYGFERQEVTKLIFTILDSPEIYPVPPDLQTA